MVADGRGLARALDRWWRAPAPAERLAAVRIVVGVFATAYLASRLPYWMSYARFDAHLFAPVGVVKILAAPLPALAVQLVTLATVLLAVPFTLGWRFRVTGPAFAVLLLWTLSYRNSWGMIFHTENLLVLHVLVLGVTGAADAWSLDAARGRDGAAPGRPARPDGRYGWPLRLLCAVVVVSYLIAGVAKLENAGLGWVWGDELRNHIAADNLRKVLLGDWSSPLAPLLLDQTWVFRLVALLSLIMEVGAPVALLGGRVAAGWAILAYAFHLGVVVLMMIFFPYQVLGVAYLPFFPAERPVGAVGRFLVRRWNGQRSSV